MVKKWKRTNRYTHNSSKTHHRKLNTNPFNYVKYATTKKSIDYDWGADQIISIGMKCTKFILMFRLLHIKCQRILKIFTKMRFINGNAHAFQISKHHRLIIGASSTDLFKNFYKIVRDMVLRTLVILSVNTVWSCRTNRLKSATDDCQAGVVKHSLTLSLYPVTDFCKKWFSSDFSTDFFYTLVLLFYFSNLT